MGYECSYTNPNPRPNTTSGLQETNAARAVALRTNTPEHQTTPQQPNSPPPPEDTQSEGKSCAMLLPNTEQQTLDRASPTQKCTHTHAYQTLPTQSDCSEIVENEISGNSLDPTFVPSHESAGVSVLDSSDNTCNAKQQNASYTRTGFRTICLGKVKLAFRQRDGRLVMVINSGATSHMNPYRGAFIKYTLLPFGHYVELVDKSKVPVLGIGTTLQRLRNKLITLTEVLHVPRLHSPLLSICSFRRRQGCAFIADPSTCCLTFPTFVLDIDDAKTVYFPTTQWAIANQYTWMPSTMSNYQLPSLSL
jgi:hypothetical protein